MALIKDVYHPTFYQEFAGHAALAIPNFDAQKFLVEVLPPGFAAMEFKQRMQHTALVFGNSLPAGFEESAVGFSHLIDRLIAADQSDKLAYVFLPEYIACFGMEHFETAVPLLRHVTRFVSAEFAVRPFLLRYFDQMIAAMTSWSLDEDHKVRRLASEGSRPRLPWAMAIPQLKTDPGPVLALLENLKADPAPWVRKSVANHLNDISKDHPERVVELAKTWKGQSAETDAIIKHACRSLLKQGHPGVLALYGLDVSGIELVDFKLHTTVATPASPLFFSFALKNTANEAQTLRLEYAVYFLRSRGQLNRKVFKISERSIGPGATLDLSRQHGFKPITTRVYYPGRHKIALVVNGKDLGEAEFDFRESADQLN